MAKIGSRFVEHCKLFEAVGLLILLVAWGLSWNSVQRWQNADDAYQGSVASFNDATDKATADLLIAYEGAVTRATAGLAIDYSQPGAAVRAAWHSAEVRHLALLQVFNDYARAGQMIKLSMDAAQREDLRVPLPLDSLNDYRERVRIALLPSIDLAKGSFKNQFPTEEEFSLEQAAQANEAVSLLLSKRFDVVNQVASGIRAERRKASRFYQIAYCIGGILLVVGKILEDRRNNRPPVSQVAQPAAVGATASLAEEVARPASAEQQPSGVA